MRPSWAAVVCAAACSRPTPPPAPAPTKQAQETTAVPPLAAARESKPPTPKLDWLVDPCAPGAQVSATAIGGKYDVVAAGSYTGAPWNDNFPLQSDQGTWDALVVKLASNNGSVVWRAGYGSNGVERVVAIAVDSNDDVYIAGSQTKLVGHQHEDGAFVAKLSGETGALEWDRRIDSNGQVWPFQLALAGDRVFAIAGFSEPITAGEHSAVPQYRGETFAVSMSRRDGDVKALTPLGGRKNYVASTSSDGTTCSALATFTGLLPRGNTANALNDDWVIAALDTDGRIDVAVELVEARGLHLRGLARSGDTFATAGFGHVSGLLAFGPAGKRFAGLLFWDENGSHLSTYPLADTDGAVTAVAPWGSAWFVTAASEPPPATGIELSVVDPADGAVSTHDVYVEKWGVPLQLASSPDRSAAALSWWFGAVTGMDGTYLETEDDRQSCAIAKFSATHD